MTVTTLLLVDVQKDFHPGGSLAIPAAGGDAERIAALLREHPEKITRVVATLDSHQRLHIAHPGFWRSGASGDPPAPFTIITSQDVADGTWTPRKDIRVPPGTLDPAVFSGHGSVLAEDGEALDLRKYALEYTRRLEEGGRFQLCIWPEHCLIGSPGHGVVDVVFEALGEWSRATGGSVEWVPKGENLLTESYSALEAEVPVDGTTAYRSDVQASLERSDRLVICGQALSHCVNYTARHVVERWPKDRVASVALLTDCASSVPGFEAAGEAFQKDMADAGVQLVTSENLFS